MVNQRAATIKETLVKIVSEQISILMFKKRIKILAIIELFSSNEAKSLYLS